MKIKMLTQYCGPIGTFKAGSVLDVDSNEARQLVAGNYAVLHNGAAVETTSAPPAPEKAEGSNAKKYATKAKTATNAKTTAAAKKDEAPADASKVKPPAPPS